MQSYWANFARAGAFGPGWPAYLAASDENIVLDVPLAVEAGHKQTVCDFWDTLR
jgi:carboxylesterase type B